MQWSDEGIVLGGRRHGEASLILELMTRDHGRCMGLVHGGRSRQLAAALQAGNTVHAIWRARLEDHLGAFQIEAEKMRSAKLMASAFALHGFAAIVALLRQLPERDPHSALYEKVVECLDRLDDRAQAPSLLIRFELDFLAEFGFGLDLYSCAATGCTENLIYVSPKTGRAVSAEAGEPYRNKLFALPQFLLNEESIANREELRAGFVLTEHFLRLHVFDPKGGELSRDRGRFIALALQDE